MRKSLCSTFVHGYFSLSLSLNLSELAVIREQLNASQVIQPDLKKIYARFCEKLRVRLSLSRQRIETGDRIQNVFDDLYFQLASDLSEAIVPPSSDAPTFRGFQLQLEPFIKVEEEEIETPVNMANYPPPPPKKKPTRKEWMEKKRLQMSKAGPSQECSFDLFHFLISATHFNFSVFSFILFS